MLVNDGGGGGTYKPPSKTEAKKPATTTRAPAQAIKAERYFSERNAALATPEPSLSVRNLLESQGWTVPPPTKTVRTPEQVFSTEKDSEKSLASFSYDVSPEEWGLITSMYGNAYGYAPPEREVQPNDVTKRSQLPPIVRAQLQKGAPTQQWLASEDVQQGKKVTMQAPQVSSAALTWEEYEALSDDQRKAVDFNTMLVEAREKDLTSTYDPTPEQRNAYDEQVTKMFGEGGGSDTYAPEVVSLLGQIDFDAVGQDLDEYLSLERAVDMDELAKFKISKNTPLIFGEENTPDTTPNYAAVRTPENLSAVEANVVDKAAVASQEAMQQAMLTSASILQSVQDTMALSRQQQVTGFGGLAVETPTLVPEDEQWFQGIYNYLMDPAVSDLGALWQEFKDVNATDKDIEDVFAYIDQRSKQELQWGRPAEIDARNSRSPADIRVLTGLGD